MSIVTHSGTIIPVLTEWFDPNEIREVWFKWPDYLTIVDSEFILQTGILEVSKKQAQSVIIDSIEYENCNAVLINLNDTALKKILITNRVTFDNGESMDKSCYVIIKTT